VFGTLKRQLCGQTTVFEFVRCPACETPIIVILCQQPTFPQRKRPVSVISFFLDFELRTGSTFDNKGAAGGEYYRLNYDFEYQRQNEAG
jgi:hypothetical protein